MSGPIRHNHHDAEKANRAQVVSEERKKNPRHKYVSEPGKLIWFKSTHASKYAFLSNFWPYNLNTKAEKLTTEHLAQFGDVKEASRPFHWDGCNDTPQLYCGRASQVTIPFKSAEHGYQAAKFNGGDVMCVHEIVDQPTALDAKKAATRLRKATKNRYDRPTFEKDKLRIMKSVLRAKFEHNAVLRKALLATSPAVLAEVPGRKPTNWSGQDGDLGRLLMEVRTELGARPVV